jgi:hypothetical protein
MLIVIKTTFNILLYPKGDCTVEVHGPFSHEELDEWLETYLDDTGPEYAVSIEIFTHKGELL